MACEPDDWEFAEADEANWHMADENGIMNKIKRKKESLYNLIEFDCMNFTSYYLRVSFI